MKDITFKVAPKGEGKTKWLISVAKKHIDEGHKVYLYTEDERDYRKFCEKYFNTFDHICPVDRLTAFKLEENDVVLVDNLLKHDSAISDFTFIQRNCYKLYITLEGTTTFEENKKTWNDFYEQITIDAMEVPNA